MKIKFFAIPLGGLLVIGILNSCSFSERLQSISEKVTSTADKQDSITQSPEQGQSQPAGSLSETPCAYIWASQSLPEESRQIEQLLNQAGMRNVRVVAEAYGENCVTAEGQIVRFAVMQTDIRLFINVQNLSDQAELGNLTRNLLKIITDIPVTDLPGSQPGYIGMQFISEQEEVLNVWFRRDVAVELLQAGVEGEELLQKLQRK
ncbi:MAG: hypothetical protein N2646_07005 [Bellilinea sp.]|nr:hypothetical protein [Bellilinea sp.]